MKKPKFKLSIMSDNDIRSISNGEVKSYSMYNFRYKIPIPTPGGLFCQSIFGPVRDYTCGCGILHNQSVTKCPVCRVSILPSKVRSNRLGHIDTKLHYINPIGLKMISEILNINTKTLKGISLGTSYFGVIKNELGSLYSVEGVRYSIYYPTDAEITTGEYYTSIESLVKMLHKYKIDGSLTLQESRQPAASLYIKKGYDLYSLFLTCVIVPPPVIRDISMVNSAIEYHPSNLLYQRLVRSGLRARSISESGDEVLDQLLPHESIVLQSLIFSLMTDGITDYRNNDIPSVLSRLQGKSGLLRGSMLGKRLDFSGRSVIAPGPELPLDTIGVPFGIAYKLLEIHIIAKIYKYLVTGDHEGNLFKAATSIYKNNEELAYDACYELSKSASLIMNRAPTLHRYGVMVFKMKIHHGKMITIPPMLCSPFNADFDGDSLGGDILIPMLDGTEKTIPDLIEEYGLGEKVWIYSYDKETNKVVPAEAKILGRAGIKNEWYHITLDNGEIIRCSKNHPFMLTDKTYSKANELAVGDNLEIFVRALGQHVDRNSGNPNIWSMDREVIRQPNGNYDLTHYAVADLKYPNKDRTGYQLHHNALLNGEYDELNNHPDNIQILTEGDHKSLHGWHRNYTKYKPKGLDRITKLEDLPINKEYWFSELDTLYPRDYWATNYHGNISITQDKFLSFIDQTVGIHLSILKEHRNYIKSIMYIKNRLTIFSIVELGGFYERGGAGHLVNMTSTNTEIHDGPKPGVSFEYIEYYMEYLGYSRIKRDKKRNKILYEELYDSLILLDQSYLKWVSKCGYLALYNELRGRYDATQLDYTKYVQDNLINTIPSTPDKVLQCDDPNYYYNKQRREDDDIKEYNERTQYSNDNVKGNKSKPVITEKKINVLSREDNLEKQKYDMSRACRVITKIEIMNYEDMSYDLEVPKYHNFALSSGVFTHNTVALHLILSKEAKSEIPFYNVQNNLMSSIYKDTPNLSPSHEQVVGLFQATLEE